MKTFTEQEILDVLEGILDISDSPELPVEDWKARVVVETIKFGLGIDDHKSLKQTFLDFAEDYRNHVLDGEPLTPAQKAGGKTLAKEYAVGYQSRYDKQNEE